MKAETAISMGLNSGLYGGVNKGVSCLSARAAATTLLLLNAALSMTGMRLCWQRPDEVCKGGTVCRPIEQLPVHHALGADSKHQSELVVPVLMQRHMQSAALL